MRNLSMATKTIGGGNLTAVRAREAKKGQGSALGKKLIATLLMVAMLFCMSGVMASGVRQESSKDYLVERLFELGNHYSLRLDSATFAVVNVFIESYENDSVFIEHFKTDEIGAIEMVLKVIDGYVSLASKTTRGWIYQGVSAPTPSIRQKWNNSCGPTSALQVIASYGAASVNDHDIIASAMGVSQFGGFTPSADGIAYQIYNYTRNGYAYINASALSLNTFRELVKSSLASDAPIILQSNPSYLPYYTASNTGGHYIVGQELSIVNDTLVLNDCHYDNRFFGIHTVSMVSAFNSIRNLISNGYVNGHLIYRP